MAKIIKQQTIFTLLFPLISQPITAQDFALLHTHGPNFNYGNVNYKLFDNNRIKLL